MVSFNFFAYLVLLTCYMAMVVPKPASGQRKRNADALRANQKGDPARMPIRNDEGCKFASATRLDILFPI